MKVSHKGRREKGRRLELKFAAMLRQFGLDKNASRMPLSGSSWAFRSDIKTSLPYRFECKNQERLNLWDWWDQCYADRGYKTPVLVFSSNNRPIMVTLKADDFLAILCAVHI